MITLWRISRSKNKFNVFWELKIVKITDSIIGISKVIFMHIQKKHKKIIQKKLKIKSIWNTKKRLKPEKLYKEKEFLFN